MHENIFTALIALDEAEALLSVEEFHLALASAHDLRRHPATARPPISAESAAATVTRTTAETVTTAAAAAETITATEPVLSAKTVAAAKLTAARCEGIETFFPKTVPLVASAPASATPSVKTHEPNVPSLRPLEPSGNASETHQTQDYPLASPENRGSINQK
jgi:hypothetical protein